MLAGPRLVGVLAALVAVAAFAWIARRHAPPGRALAATWLFVGGALSNVVIGRMPFMLGVCLAILRVGGGGVGPARRAGGAHRRPRSASPRCCRSRPCGRAPWPASSSRSPRSGARSAAARQLPACAALAAPAVAGGLAVGVVFPEGGPDHFTASAFWPTLLLAGAGSPSSPPRAAACGRRRLLYLSSSSARIVLPASLGQNALRPGVVPRPGAARARPPRDRRLLVVLVAGALLYLCSCCPPCAPCTRPRGDPSSKPAFHSEVLRVIGERLQPGERLEVPLTRNHWEAAFLAPAFPLARGSHRQLVRESNPIFYDKQPLTAGAYRASSDTLCSLSTGPASRGDRLASQVAARFGLVWRMSASGR